MFSKIFLSEERLYKNIDYIKKNTNGKICAMIKANAYGHGLKELLPILNERIDYFGVSNEDEAFLARKYTNKTIIVFGLCQDYKKCMENKISFAVFSPSNVLKIINIAKACKLKPRMHLCVNTGMNRYGIKKTKDLKKIIKLLNENNMELEGIYTHFSSLTTDREYTKNQKDLFQKFIKIIPAKWNTLKHIGGGKAIFENLNYDMVRIGIPLYGYEIKEVLPILSIESEIVSVQNVKKGEHVGYLCGFTADKDMTIATIPLGYADGLPRKLSNKFEVNINGKKARSIGNICMDAFMVDIDNIKCKIGDKVTIMNNANYIATILGTTEYEVLTNFNKFRGERIIVS